MNLEHIDKEVDRLQGENTDNEKKITLLKRAIKMNLRLIREYKTGKEAMIKAQENGEM